MNRLENALVDLIWQQELEPSRWLGLVSKIARFCLDAINYIDRELCRLRCWFAGHQVSFGEYWIQGPDYCPKCFIDWPLESATLPTLFNRAYCWAVERDWRRLNYMILKWQETRAAIRRCRVEIDKEKKGTSK